MAKPSSRRRWCAADVDKGSGVTGVAAAFVEVSRALAGCRGATPAAAIFRKKPTQPSLVKGGAKRQRYFLFLP